MFIGSSPAHAKVMNRLSACIFTVRQSITDLEDPKELDLRADLMIQAQDLLNEVVHLNDLISKMTWQELDQKAHPSNN
jgi:hypothetical protein